MSMNDTLQILSTNSNTSTILGEKLVQKILLGCLLSSLSIFTVCGNILVLYAIQTEKYLRTVSNLFILSLAFADLAVGLCVMPLSAANIIAGRWLFSPVICKMWLSIDYVASTASIFNLVLLSLDRYWAVVYPLRYLHQRTRRRATIFILIVWLISLLWAPAVIFWSYIVPQYSDTIKPDECDTSFRLNKTFKTLATLVNFYFPLITMIIISCRIMVAIRLRSKLELGRQLPPIIPKKTKRDRTHTIVSLRSENEPTLKSKDTDIDPSLTKSVANPLDSSILKYKSISNHNNITAMIGSSQCFCSTCHTSSVNDNDNLWQLQQTSIKKPASLLEERLSFVPINPASIMLLSKIDKQENKNHTSQDLPRKASLNENTIRNSLSISNNMRYSLRRNSNEQLERKLSSVITRKATLGTLSRETTISGEYPETLFGNLIEKQQKSEPIENLIIRYSRTSNDSSSTNSYVKLPTTQTTNSLTTIKNHSSSHSSKHNRIKSNFFNRFINPSRSSSIQKELKAARQLSMLVGVFTITWLPYFILFFVVAWCNHCISDSIYTASIWLGYLNSTVNPLIYPLCNVHFRRAFQKICYCKHAKTKLPNLNALRELHALYAMRRER